MWLLESSYCTFAKTEFPLFTVSEKYILNTLFHSEKTVIARLSHHHHFVGIFEQTLHKALSSLNIRVARQ